MNAQEIAAGAAQTIETNSDGNLAYKTAIIQSAIEKATEELRDKLELTDAAYAELNRQFIESQSRAAHAIEKATESLRNTNVNLLRSLNEAQGEIIEMRTARELTSRAAHASEKPKFNLETLEGRKAAWAWLQQQQFGNPLVVTKDGIPLEDQAEGIQQFKDAARKPAHASECNHQWTHHSILTSKNKPPLEIDQCVRCGVVQKQDARASEP